MHLHAQPAHGQFEPKYESIDFVDVARKLSRLCCYGGKTRKFYSEAERSVRIASLMPQYKIYGLLHAVPKAFLGNDDRAPGSSEGSAAINTQVLALRFGDIDVPDEVREYLENSPYTAYDALPVSRGEIRGFGPKDRVDGYVEMQVRRHAYELFARPIDLSIPR